MARASGPASLGLVLVATYYATTLALWAGHWFSHLPWSPFRTFHLGGHHTLYPDSRHTRSAVSLRFGPRVEHSRPAPLARDRGGARIGPRRRLAPRDHTRRDRDPRRPLQRRPHAISSSGAVARGAPVVPHGPPPARLPSRRRRELHGGRPLLGQGLRHLPRRWPVLTTGAAASRRFGAAPPAQSLTSLAKTMSGIARISSISAGDMGSSRFRMETARPPRRSRPSCMPAMLIPCRPQSVPMRPMTPGTSRLAKTSIQPCGRASIGKPSIRTKRASRLKKTVPATDEVPRSVTSSAATRLA